MRQFTTAQLLVLCMYTTERLVGNQAKLYRKHAVQIVCEKTTNERFYTL